MNKLKAVVDRLVRETGLSRTVSRRIAKKINRMVGEVKWATPLRSSRKAEQSVAPASKAPSGGPIILPKIAASKPVTRGRTAIPRPRPR